MDIYLINLDSRPDRMAFMSEQLERLGLDYTRISAVDGLGDADIGYPADHPRLSKGEYACYLSHVMCWERFIESGAERCLVLEDDLALADSLAEILAHHEFYNHSGVITRLETRIFRTKVSKLRRHRLHGRKLRRITGYDGGGGALVLTRDYVAYLLQNHHIPTVPVDDVMLDPQQTTYHPHTVYQLDPAPATQRMFLDPSDPAHEHDSDLHAGRLFPDRPVEVLTLQQKVNRELRRRGRNIRDNLLHTFKVIPFSKD